MHRWQGKGGVSIAGDSWGPNDGPLVFLQHGGGQTRHAWKSAGEFLGKAGYFAVAFDARGHGDSDWSPDGVYGQDVMVEDLLCVTEQLGGQRPVLVGASMGGGTSLVAIGEDRIDATALWCWLISRPGLNPKGSKRSVTSWVRSPTVLTAWKKLLTRLLRISRIVNARVISKGWQKICDAHRTANIAGTGTHVS